MVGEIAAISTALCWAVAARLFRVLGQHFSVLSLNLWKGILSCLLLILITQLFLPSVSINTSAIAWLLLSGAIGIGIGDSCFFQALIKIGDSQSILVAETLAPIFTALLAMVWIAEWLSPMQWLAIAVVLFSVDMVIKVQRNVPMQLFDLSGYAFAALAALCQAIGAVISRDVLTTYEIDAFNGSLVRLLGGLVIVVAMLLVSKQSWLPKSANLTRTWFLFTGATVVGTLVALSLQMVAFSYAKAAVVQTLFATSVIMSLFIARLMGETIARKTIIWSLIALTGVALLVALEQV